MRSRTHSTGMITEDFEILDDEGILDEVLEEAVDNQWLILIIDDDEEMHVSTKFALKNVRIFGKTLKFIGKYTAKEGFEALETNENVAVILLDVVMEYETSGLELVKKIRDHEFFDVRIILRTGQPGYAPELSVLQDYDINDYRSKSELTRVRLISALTTAIRSYRQLNIINESRRGLDLIVQGSRDFHRRNSLELFAEGVLIQIFGLLGVKRAGLVSLFSDFHSFGIAPDKMNIITATDRFKDYVNMPLINIKDEEVSSSFELAKINPQGVHIDKNIALYFSANNNSKMFVYVDDGVCFSSEQIALLKVFATNISISFDNIALIERLDRLAYIDGDLGLPNRNAFISAYGQCSKQKKELCLAQVHIKAYSHLVGVFGVERVNKAIVKKYEIIKRDLKHEYMAIDNIANILILFDPAVTSVERLTDFFDDDVEVDGVHILFTASVSIVGLSQNVNITTALRHAISSSNVVKKTPGTNLIYYTDRMSKDLEFRFSLHSNLRKSLSADGDILSYLQPKVSCKTKKITGAEVLTRWKYGSEFIDPALFIPIAEATGLISNITSLSLANVSKFKHAGTNRAIFPLSVNLSIYEINKKAFAAGILQEMVDLGLDPLDLDFEITESVMIKDTDKIIKELHVLKDNGFKLSIDDFGTGYSSLQYLDRLPVDCIKIDQCFVQTLDTKHPDESIVASAISIAKNFNMSVISEGVETIEQFDTLVALGCDVCQGFLFGPAVPMESFEKIYADLL